MRSAVVCVSVLGLALIGGACKSGEESAAEESIDSVDVVAEPGDVVVESEEVVPGDTTSVTTRSLDPVQVTSCVEQASFGNYTGDPVWTQFWNDAGQTEAGADAACRWLGANDPAELQTIHEGWLQVQAFLAAAEPAPEP
jgi:hypothetical protein